ncbi:GerAB/ArcD/ProY family transporter [Desulforamulus ruminis]|uniref:Spore germination protein n=1 Tax=Desulforamulus ruminis (strain ATCC 23193 / DSM 2154 / NCIMB 8452 / DL) TaxID=696281 RepID=F6DKP0_DESRL|nr:endospore germination permease [Desulforamulus ruminis]AEG60415.1 spore germination protein [Desulforamulus ruminis DSM 2154]
MLEGGKISTRQAIFLLTTTIFATVILFVPSITANYAMQDAWISVLLATACGLLMAWLITRLGLYYPDKTIFEYAGKIVGRWPGKAVGLLYILWFLHLNAEVIREYGELMTAAFMPDTPIIVFHLIVVALAAYAVRNGLEVLTRANEVFFPVILGSIILVLLLSIGNMDFNRLLPIWDAGAIPVLKGSLVPLSWFGEIVTIMILLPYLNKPGKAYQVSAAALLISGLLLLSSVVGALAIFGPQLSGAWMFPTLNNARIISIANFIERMEPFVMGVWVTGGFIKISVFFWVVVLGTAQILELKDYRPLVLPIGATLVALSMFLNSNILDLLLFLSQVWPAYALSIFEVGIPLLLLVIAWLRGKKEGSHE